MEQSGFWQYWAHAATAAVLALGGWVFKRQDNRIDAIETQQENYLTRDELATYINLATAERRDMHQDNKLEFERLNRRIDRLHEMRGRDVNSQ
jgi:hypothetical protein